MAVQVTCINCGKTWAVPPSWAAKKYCSIKCRKAHINGDECKVEGCSQPPHSQGLCPMHYQRNRRHSDPLPSLPKFKHVPKSHPPCTVPGCGRPHYARSYCQGHYARWKKGDVMADVPFVVGQKFGTQLVHGTLSGRQHHKCDCDLCMNAYRAYYQRWRETHIPGYKPNWKRRAERERRRSVRIETVQTVEALRAQVDWNDDPTPRGWRLASLTEAVEGIDPMWDWEKPRLSDQVGNLNHPEASKFLRASLCPTIERLTDRALDGEKLAPPERLLLALAFRHKSALVHTRA